jgi:hypothetical protein
MAPIQGIYLLSGESAMAKKRNERINYNTRQQHAKNKRNIAKKLSILTPLIFSFLAVLLSLVLGPEIRLSEFTSAKENAGLVDSHRTFRDRLSKEP